MTETRTLDPDMTVDEIMRRWPATIRVMIRNQMLCVGCPIGVFHTVMDACNAHGVDAEAFEEELLVVMRNDDLTNATGVFEATGA
jgi:hybrid cluster-associated redox disulfide protein